MADPFVAEIRIFGFNFPPTGWAQCNGQILPISQNTALFSLLGTFYGGDGKSTFALPNLQGSVPLHQGQSTTGTQWFLGQQAGSQFVTLLQSEIPAHTHIVKNFTIAGNQFGPTPTSSITRSLNGLMFNAGPGNVQAAFQSISVAGGSLPHNNMMPYLTLNFCIALQGVFPPRS
jgi:microcystin-dependent protein